MIWPISCVMLLMTKIVMIPLMTEGTVVLMMTEGMITLGNKKKLQKVTRGIVVDLNSLRVRNK